MNNLEALFDAVIVKPLEVEEETYGSIVVPDMGKDKNEHGEVIAVGPGKPTITGEIIPTTVKVGDKEHNGEEYYIGPENQVLAKINNKK